MTALAESSGSEWAGRIRSAWQRSVDAIIETGRLIAEAKAALPHGAFLSMIEAELPFTSSTAQRLMKIAADERLSDAARVQHLPPSWGALYELTKLDDSTLNDLFEKGAIRPDMTREDIAVARPNLRAAIGTDSATAAERGNNLYETPPEAVHALLALERFDGIVWEPACGRGAICRVLEAAGHETVYSDLVDYERVNADGELQEVGDFLETRWSEQEAGIRGAWLGALWTGARPSIVTNPPYGPALNGFVAHALREFRPPKMALLLNLNFLCGFDDPDRVFAMDDCPPARVHVLTRRLPMMHRDGWDGPEASSRMNTAWFVWERARGEEGEGRPGSKARGGGERRSAGREASLPEPRTPEARSRGPEGGTPDREITEGDSPEGQYLGPTILNRVDWKAHQPEQADSDSRARRNERGDQEARSEPASDREARQEAGSAERDREAKDSEAA